MIYKICKGCEHLKDEKNAYICALAQKSSQTDFFKSVVMDSTLDMEQRVEKLLANNEYVSAVSKSFLATKITDDELNTKAVKNEEFIPPEECPYRLEHLV